MDGPRWLYGRYYQRVSILHFTPRISHQASSLLLLLSHPLWSVLLRPSLLLLAPLNFYELTAAKVYHDGLNQRPTNVQRDYQLVNWSRSFTSRLFLLEAMSSIR